MKDLKVYTIKLRIKLLFTENILNKISQFKHNLTFTQLQYPEPGKH